MIKGLLGRKIGMTQIFDKEGNLLPVTVVSTGPCIIIDLKDEPKKKVTIGFEEAKESKVNKPRAGVFKKAGTKSFRIVREFLSSDNSELKVGQELKADVFKPGDFVDVSGTTVGKGFQGGMKRHHWAGGPGGHGSHHHRRVGSIGASADPSRTFRGFPMPGQMGNERATTQGVRVMDVDLENNILLLKGAVPGAKQSVLEINLSFKKEWKDLNVVREFVKKKVNPMKQSKAKAGKKKGK